MMATMTVEPETAGEEIGRIAGANAERGGPESHPGSARRRTGGDARGPEPLLRAARADSQPRNAPLQLAAGRPQVHGSVPEG